VKPSWDDVYKRSTHAADASASSDEAAVDPNDENVTAILLARSSKLRRLLWLTLGAALVAGVTAITYLIEAVGRVGGRMYGFLLGLSFVGGAVITFAILHRMSGIVARARESRWARKLAKQHHLSEQALSDTLQMLE